MPLKARPMSEEEEEALEAVGQAREEGRTIPTPEMVLFTGETALKVRELADHCGLPPQEVIGIALQEFYEKVHAEAKAERAREENDRSNRVEQTVPQPPKDADPWRPH